MSRTSGDPRLPGLRRLPGRVGARYAACGRYTQGYVAWKLRLDPVHRAVFTAAAGRPLGHVLDLGCGLGQFGIALLELGLARRVTGLDWDEPLIDQARVAGAGLAARFDPVDLQAGAIPPVDCALLIDLLYQLPADRQRDLITRTADAVRDRVFIRALDPDRGWRSVVGRNAERLSRLAGLYRPAEIAPTPVMAFARWLEACGFACTVEPCWGATPFPNVLLIARRRDGSASHLTPDKRAMRCAS